LPLLVDLLFDRYAPKQHPGPTNVIMVYIEHKEKYVLFSTVGTFRCLYKEEEHDDQEEVQYFRGSDIGSHRGQIEVRDSMSPDSWQETDE
jgi:hypothetical protein